MVGAYVALATPRDQRHVVVTGFQVQVAVLRLVGTSLYPVVDSMLIACGIEHKLLRYRIHMSPLGATLADWFVSWDMPPTSREAELSPLE